MNFLLVCICTLVGTLGCFFLGYFFHSFVHHPEKAVPTDLPKPSIKVPAAQMGIIDLDETK
jgi:hypothetical protein